MVPAVKEKPIVYSCSGCSSAAQMANYIAIQMDRKGIAEMSCIAGVGGNVKKLVKTAKSGRKIITIDGCPLACSKACLGNHDILPDLHFELTSFGVKKIQHGDFELKEAGLVLEDISLSLAGLERNGKASQPLAKNKPGLQRSTISDILIKEVKDNNQLKEFIDFPYRLYKGNNNYIPHLKKDVEETFSHQKNPAFEFCEVRLWLAYRNKRVIGRVAAIINHSFNEKWKKKYMRFGWMDMEQDPAIAHVLLTKVEEWAKEKSMEAVHGPIGFTNFDHAGFLTKGYSQEGTFATIYNYPYYPLYLEKEGYTKDVDWVEFKIKVPKEVPSHLEKIASIVQKRYNLQIVKPGSSREVLSYASEVFALLNSTYKGLFGFVSLNDKQVAFHTKKYLSFIRPDFMSLILDSEGKLAAFGITIPSLSKALKKAGGRLYPFGLFYLLKAYRRNKGVDLCLIAVREDFQGKGVNALLMTELTKTFIKNGIEFAESNPELEDNTKVQSVWEHFEAVKHKQRRCYIKYLHYERNEK